MSSGAASSLTYPLRQRWRFYAVVWIQTLLSQLLGDQDARYAVPFHSPARWVNDFKPVHSRAGR
jgi:hypothetical protein